MSEFWIFVEVGLKHILNIKSYDHLLFLMVLSVPYSFKEWRRILLLITLFTIGHSLSLLLSVIGILTIQKNIIELLIPITILITALFNIFSTGKSPKNDKINWIGFVTFFFGIIHGMGFSTYFKSLLPGNLSDKILPLIEFSLGIELAQIIITLFVLILSYILLSFFRFSKRDFILAISAFVIGVVVPMILENDIIKWN